MKNKILFWLVTTGLCIVLIPIGCILLILLFPVVFALANKLNVQLFIATHSIEDIDALNDIPEEREKGSVLFKIYFHIIVEVAKNLLVYQYPLTHFYHQRESNVANQDVA